MKWFFRLPLSVRIPLLTAVMIFMIAMVVTQMAVFSLSRQYELQTERVGQVYLDGLSAAVLSAYQANDSEGIHRALTQSLTFYLGVVDRQLALVDREAGLLAHVSGPNLANPTPPPVAVFHNPKGYVYEPESRSLWVWRELGATGVIAANLDISAFADERALLRFRLVLIGAGLSLFSAFGGYIVIRRIQRPLSTLSDHLAHAVAFGPQRIEAQHISRSDKEAHILMHAYNRMVEAVQDREQLSERLAKQDQQALLGRIAATLAHEIRNPLTGIMTALQTIRMYGHHVSSRSEALDFIDRGIQSLQGVAEATLNAYRPSAPGPDLAPRDLHDVILLVAPHAARKQVELRSRLQLDASVKVDAFKIRQIALNLLLNAVQTSPEHGAVSLHCACENDSLFISISDDGPGLPLHAQDFLMAGGPQHSDRSLGLETVRRLAQELDGRIVVRGKESGGSMIELTFFIPKERSE